MRLLDKYLIISSVLALFSEDFSFHYIIDWKLFYVILLLNFSILSYISKITLNKNFVILLFFLIIHGVLGFIIFSNPIQSLISQILGISISSIFYYNLIKRYNVKKLIDSYLVVAFIMAVIAIPMFYLNIGLFISYRLDGLMSEPAHYAAIMLPAIYLLFRRKNYIKALIILITIFLSKSSVGFIGLFLILIIPLLKIKYFLKYALFAVIIILVSGFYLSSKWNDPIDENYSNGLIRRLKQTSETLSATYTGEFKHYTNLSTYAFLSNTFITQKIFFEKPLGTGIGSYKHEYDKYYENLKPPKYLINSNLSKINRTDANSLFLRMIADLGIFALITLSYFFYRSYKIFTDDKKTIQQSTFFYLVVKLMREGHYFSPEFYFFLLIFLNNSNEDITHS